MYATFFFTKLVWWPTKLPWGCGFSSSYMDFWSTSSIIFKSSTWVIHSLEEMNLIPWWALKSSNTFERGSLCSNDFHYMRKVPLPGSSLPTRGDRIFWSVYSSRQWTVDAWTCQCAKTCPKAQTVMEWKQTNNRRFMWHSYRMQQQKECWFRVSRPMLCELSCRKGLSRELH